MAKIFYQPTRMCVSCRNRDIQMNLLRLQCSDGDLSPFKKLGRSFYFCKTCLQEDKKISKALMRYCKSADKEKLMNKLKEIITDDRKS